MIRTQKAKGVNALIQASFPVSHLFTTVPAGFITNESLRQRPIKKEIIDYCKTHNFLRPCPMRPRHGFVESRVVQPEELEAFFDEVLAADPYAEVIAMPLIEAVWSGIITNAGVVLGPGNDGATAGKKAIFIPAQGRIEKILPTAVRMAGIIESPYIEVVGRKKGKPVLVQLRDGPPLNGDRDFIPGEVVVKRVIKIKGNEDLLEWERFVKGLTPGDVVYHPGGSLASHYGVHCVLNRVPYITSFEPKVGQKLNGHREPVHDLDAVIGALDRFGHRGELKRFGRANRLLTAFAVVHAAGSIFRAGITKATGNLLGFALQEIVRASAAASMGEARYINTSGPHFSVKLGIYEGIVSPGGYKPSRRYVYGEAYTWPFEKLVEALDAAVKLFEPSIWGGGFGGKNWQDSSRMALDLGIRLIEFTSTGKLECLKKAVEAANQLVHAVHNNGWYLNKIADPGQLDNVAAAPQFYLASNLVWQVINAPRKRKIEPLRFEVNHGVEVKTITFEERVNEYLEEIEHDEMVDEVPEDAIPAKIQVRLWGANWHFQVGCAKRLNREYGLAFEASNRNMRKAFAIVWTTGKKNQPTLNPSDSHEDYRRVEGFISTEDGIKLYIPFEGRWFVCKL